MVVDPTYVVSSGFDVVSNDWGIVILARALKSSVFLSWSRRLVLPM